jgi:hypothetical protein
MMWEPAGNVFHRLTTSRPPFPNGYSQKVDFVFDSVAYAGPKSSDPESNFYNNPTALLTQGTIG